jgi:hypothetical protein
MLDDYSHAIERLWPRPEPMRYDRTEGEAVNEAPVFDDLGENDHVAWSAPRVVRVDHVTRTVTIDAAESWGPPRRLGLLVHSPKRPDLVGVWSPRRTQWLTRAMFLSERLYGPFTDKPLPKNKKRSGKSPPRRVLRVKRGGR